MTPSRARRKFPQLANSTIKYCPVFYEGQHDDARTNLAIAQTAAKEGKFDMIRRALAVN
jgi:glycerol-3-phosphate dehydrogenase